MPLMLMSNPGLHLAVLGNPGKKKKTWSRKTSRGSAGNAASRLAWWRHHHNPRSKPTRRKHSTRSNPVGALNSYISAVKRAPSEVIGVFKGRNKVKHIAFAAGGAVGTFALGGIITANVVAPLLARVGGGAILASPIGKRLIGGLTPFTIGYVASKFVKGDIGKALLVGGAAASLIELVSPGMIAGLVYRTPVVGPTIIAAAPAAAVKGPVNGLDGYVAAQAYQGTGDDLDGYVAAQAYQGTGDDLADDLDGYVDAQAYQGTGEMEDDLASDEMAGVDGYLTDANKYMETYLN